MANQMWDGDLASKAYPVIVRDGQLLIERGPVVKHVGFIQSNAGVDY